MLNGRAFGARNLYYQSQVGAILTRDWARFRLTKTDVVWDGIQNACNKPVLVFGFVFTLFPFDILQIKNATTNFFQFNNKLGFCLPLVFHVVSPMLI